MLIIDATKYSSVVVLRKVMLTFTSLYTANMQRDAPSSTSQILENNACMDCACLSTHIDSRYTLHVIHSYAVLSLSRNFPQK